MKRFKPYILPAAIVLGLLFHSQVAAISGIVPYVIFAILLLNFCAVDLRSLRFNRLDLRVMVFQIAVSLGGYLALSLIPGGETAAQGWLIVVLCPVASAVVVVSSELGADRRITTGYTIYGNLLVAVAAPVIFSFIGEHRDMAFLDSFLLILGHIAPVIALPYFVALALQWFAPKAKQKLAAIKEWTLPLWGIALLTTLGKTINYIFLYHKGNEWVIMALGGLALLSCVMQFGIGRLLGRRFAEPIAGAQLTGQKNSAMGIWMASVYLTPLASVILAFYSIFQNLWNSWQLWRHKR